ncbi:urease subunit gamma [Mycobacterium sp. NAZ190054]|uniref:urease subunit gamma n=1 Tax=Mycobacterium sp. NAZ190054 TaxID=1747766 RepID=UPI0007938676|nr:urease subunit gamma [Mycobacterium sp. NAZ190054]KWX68628.1 urease subunit beta [Mycobacterium sp. NAZ190054]
MHLTVREEERMQLWTAAEMARRRLSKGIRLNQPEAVALICDEILERAREGSIPVLPDLMEYGATILRREHVMAGVAEMLKIVQVEALLPDGTKLVTVMDPIRGEASDSNNQTPAAAWQPPPIPEAKIPEEAFAVGEPHKVGHIEFAPTPITINAERESHVLDIVNTGDRPVQVGAHYHLAEANRALAFDRSSAFGFRLDIPSGTSVRFEPGQSRRCQLVRLGGAQVARGMNDITNGPTGSALVKEQAMRRLRAGGYCFEGETLEMLASKGSSGESNS